VWPPELEAVMNICSRIPRLAVVLGRIFNGSRAIVGVAFTGALLVGLTLGLQAHDPSLDTADAALEKAMILLSITECPTVDPKVQDECTKEIERAIRNVERAREHVAAAALVSDTVTSAQ
jgi:hypothetical protein